MKIERSTKEQVFKKRIGACVPGDVVLNSAGNLVMVLKQDGLAYEHAFDKVRLVNLENGGTYTVRPDCCYEPVDAKVVWTRFNRRPAGCVEETKDC